MDREETQADGGMRDEIGHRLTARINTLEEELDRVRSRGRIYGLGLVTVLGMALVALLGGDTLIPSSGAAEVVETSRLVLTGPDGQPRGEWGVDADGNSTLSMLDRQRRPRLTFTVRNEGHPGMSLSNTAGERRVALGLLPDETGSLVFADGSGIPRTVVGLVRGQSASLVLADAGGVSRIGLGLDAQGVGTVMLPDTEVEEGIVSPPGSPPPTGR